MGVNGFLHVPELQLAPEPLVASPPSPPSPLFVRPRSCPQAEPFSLSCGRLKMGAELPECVRPKSWPPGDEQVARSVGHYDYQSIWLRSAISSGARNRPIKNQRATRRRPSSLWSLFCCAPARIRLTLSRGPAAHKSRASGTCAWARLC